ncbi:MFS transporter [Fervidicella metallireducens]|uniref:MFS transporter n=1 Tax=Fervidicella metallireducens TaxID=655338 RepID=UPI000684A366|nr:MFS transporter [Fervidicella metallireducens]
MKRHVVPTIYLFIYMIALGFSENMRGLFIPIIKNEFNINDSYIGYLLLISSIGYILFQYIGGAIIQKLDHKRVYLIALVTTISAFVMIYFSKTFGMLLGAMFVLNAGFSLYSIATNSLIPVMFIGFQAVLMNLTHCCYGFGTSLGQRLTGLMLDKGIMWRELYLLDGIIFTILLLVFFFIKFPSVHVESRKERTSLKSVLNNKLAVLFMFALGFYVFSELGVANWFANLLKTGYGFSQDKTSIYLAIFYFVFTIGRLVGGFIVEKVGHIKALIVSLMCAMIIFLAGLIGGKGTVILISISGFFFSIGFPTIVLIVNNTFKENTSYILGIVISAASTINMIINLIVGYLNDIFGVYKTFYLIPISLFMTILLLSIIKLKISGKNQGSI